MARDFLVSIDLNKNELQNAAIQNLATPPGSPATGQVYYDTSTTPKELKIWDGAAWVTVGYSEEQIEDFVDGLIVAGTGISKTYDDGANTLTITNTGITSLTGTASEIDVSASTGAVTLSLPSTINANLNGNASTASTLETARIISITGDATGSASFNGGSNISIPVVIDSSSNVSSITGTVNEIEVSASVGAVILGLPNSVEINTLTITDHVVDQINIIGTGTSSHVGVEVPVSASVNAWAQLSTTSDFATTLGLNAASGQQSVIDFYHSDTLGATVIYDESLNQLEVGAWGPSNTGSLKLSTANGNIIVKGDGDVQISSLDTAGIVTTTSAGLLSSASAVPVANGGTGLTATPTNGQLLIGNGTGYTLSTITDGTGISVTEGSGSITIANTDLGSSQNIFKNVAVSGQNTIVADSNNDTLTFVGSGITITTNDGTDTVTFTNAGVTSISFDTTGLTPSTSTTGAVTVGGTLDAKNGGTGQASYAIGDLLYASASTTLTKLSAAATGNVLLSGTAPSWGKVGLTTHVSGTLGIGNGGTGLSSTPTNGQLLIGNGTNYSLATLTQGTGITITNGSGTISVANAGVVSIAGTTNQVSVSASVGAVTLSLPQNIHTGAEPTFAGAALGNIRVGITGDNEIDTSSGNLTIDSAGGTVTIDDNLTVTGDLTVSGSVTYLNTQTLQVSDNLVVLNYDVTGTPTENAGIEIERGTSANVSLLWNETDDRWTMTNDGTNFYVMAKKYSANLSSSSTAYTVTHNLNDRDVAVNVYRNSAPYDTVETDVERTDANTVTLRFAVAPTSNEYRVVVVG